MKDYKDMAENVLRRRDRYVIERKKQMKKAAAVLSCFCLAALLGIGVWHNSGLSDSRAGDIVPGGVSVGSSADIPGNPGADKAADGKEGVQGSDALRVRINRLETAPETEDMDVQYDSYEKLPYDVWEAIVEKFHAVTGIEYYAFLERIPAQFRDNCAFFSLSTRGYKDAGRNEDYLLHDYVFECYSDSGATAIIALCGFEEPLRDCFIQNDDLEESRINETMVTICEYRGIYWAKFTYQGVNYDIETRDLDQAGLEALLTSLLAA